MALGMPDHATGYEVHLGNGSVALAPVADQLPVPLHGPQAAGQSFDFPVAFQPPFREEFVQRQRHPPLFQRLDDELPTGNRFAVFFLFPSREGITLLPGTTFFISHCKSLLEGYSEVKRID